MLSILSIEEYSLNYTENHILYRNYTEIQKLQPVLVREVPEYDDKQEIKRNTELLNWTRFEIPLYF